jgi:hypothetical protein
MEENKFYKNADLSKESEEDFKKNVKNSFSTEDFSRQLDLAMYLSKSKFKQVFFNQDKITYLKDECTALLPDECDRNVIIYGTPYCKQFGNWSFMREEESLKEIYSMIPNDIDILLTHDAPDLNELGTIHEFNWNYNQTKINAGNKILAKEILKKKPKYAFCGHIHSGNHTLTDLNGIKVANVSRMNEKYEPVNEVLYIEI